MIKATVLLITYNHERYIRQSIDSALAQVTDFDYEILISDDCSTDGTRQILIDYAREHPDKIRLRLNQENQNSNEDFEQALLATKGEYIAFLEGDDYWTSVNKLQKAVNYLDAHQDYSMWWHRMEYVDADRRPTEIQQEPFERSHYTLQDFFSVCPIATVGAAVIRRSCVKSPLPSWYYSSPLTDYVLWIICAESGPAYQQNEILGAYRIHTNGYFNGRSEEGRAEIAALAFHDFYRQVSADWQKQLASPVARCWADYALKQRRAGNHRASRETAKKGLTDRPGDMRLLILAYIPWAWNIVKSAYKTTKRTIRRS